jgi:hypothetical protein
MWEWGGERGREIDLGKVIRVQGVDLRAHLNHHEYWVRTGIIIMFICQAAMVK